MLSTGASRSPASGSRIDYIDGLRGLAIFGVIAAHTASSVGLGGDARRLTDAAGMGVQLFFLVSALTIFLTYERSRGTDLAPVRNFLLKRCFRIVPVYWFGILLYAAIYGLGSRGWDPAPQPSHFLLNAALLNDLHPLAANSVVPGGWSISCEVLFYLTAPLWFGSVRSARGALIFTLACTIAGPVIVAALAAIFGGQLGAVPPADATRFLYRIFPNQLGCFGLGMLLFFLVREQGILCRSLRGPFASGAGLAAAACLFVAAASYPTLMIRHDLICFSFFLLALTLAQSPPKGFPRALLVNAATRLLGRVSYSAYLIHFIVLDMLGRWLPLPSAASGAFWLLLAATLGCTIITAYVMHVLLEKPAVGWGKGLIARLECRARRDRVAEIGRDLAVR